MKRIFITTCIFLFCLTPFGCEEAEQIQTAISEGDITSGLKEALKIGASKAGNSLSLTDGYFKGGALKLLLPIEAQPIIKYIGVIPGGQPLLDEVVLLMNRGAEKAASKAAPIFVSAIDSFTVKDGKNILLGADTAATNFLRVKTFRQLSIAFAPEINNSMNEVGAAEAWNTLFKNYNNYISNGIGIALGLSPVNTNLGQYATEKALNGLFKKVAEEEKNIRDNPLQRTTDLLQRVFKLQDSQ
jgi:hypothetical protein